MNSQGIRSSSTAMHGSGLGSLSTEKDGDGQMLHSALGLAKESMILLWKRFVCKNCKGSKNTRQRRKESPRKWLCLRKKRSVGILR